MMMTEEDKKQDRRVQRSREALRNALLALMKQKSFGSISITEIVETANYNRGTFYAHYESKEALLDDIIAELIRELLRSFRAPYEGVDVFRVSELSANSVMIFDHIYENASLYAVLLKSEVLPKVREAMLLALKGILVEELQPVDDGRGINQELLVVYSIHALLGLVFYWVENDFNYSPAYMQEQLVKIIHTDPSSARSTVNRPHK
ncbi:TetR/AcrR family transcriptional regulator [Paenibacillus sp. GCM10023250]|uniref:TetR/AcrR family transcriptional regulator n=1 Tax=Paenibacillus sp. GCM10023250 TaxID=3252648 RepID=UPI0036101CF6